jgi:predicted RNA-binding Zn-ribbon protein involved in translation (DUF1610 family)
VKPILGGYLPEEVKSAVVGSVEKTLRCGTEENGFARFRCPDCGAVRIVAFKCKSRFCPDCGKARAAEAAAKVQSRLLNVGHRQLVFSVPSELRPLLYKNRKLLAVVAKSAAEATIHAVGTRCKANAPLPGVMATVHTFGRDLGFHVHVHVLCTEGGLRSDKVWQSVHLFPARQYRKLWQYYLLRNLRKAMKGDRRCAWRIGRLHTKHPTGFIVNVANHYTNGRKAAAYCCRYTGRPPIADRRIVAYDGKHVTISYRDFKDNQDKTLTLTAEKFLLRLFAHVWPRYMRSVHYYGLYQPSRGKERVEDAVKASKFHDQVRPVPAASRRERMAKALNDLELQCLECGSYVILEHIEYAGRRYEKKVKGPPGSQRWQLSLSM